MLLHLPENTNLSLLQVTRDGVCSLLSSLVCFYLDRKFSPFPAQVTALHRQPVARLRGNLLLLLSLWMPLTSQKSQPIRGKGSGIITNQMKGNVEFYHSYHTFGSSQPQSDLWCGEQREHRAQNRDNFISHHVLSTSHHPSTWRCQQNNKLSSKSWTLTPF